jgi:AbiTii-like protein
MQGQSTSEHILELATELLGDIELSRLNAESLLLKASRLARLVGSDEIRQWIGYEMSGYNSTESLSVKYVGKTGRWADQKKSTAYWGPLAQQETAIEALKAQIASMKTPDTSGDYAGIAIQNITRAMGVLTTQITRRGGIKSRVLAILHKFISDVYYEKVFDNLSESIFEKYKNDVDALIIDNCGEVLHQIPAVMNRLADGDEESISQALSTCRRMLDSFADSIFPPTDEIIEIGGKQLTLDANKHQNRINAFVHQHCGSTSRKKKIRQNLSNLYDRVATGVHNEVSAEEAKALFLNTYLLMGEVLHIKETNV